MAKFRTNHNKGKRGRSGNPIRMGMTVVILCVLLVGLLKRVGGDGWFSMLFQPAEVNVQPPEERFYLPSGGSGSIIHHQFYSLSYSEQHEQAEWVAYPLERERLKMPYVKRTNDFRPDPAVNTRSANDDDFRGSGYDRGHLVPAADMAFKTEAMSETFFMSNISPQVHTFNGGIWRELEELTRGWAKYFKRLYVVTGPVLTEAPEKWIGRNNVAVPTAYFKVLLDVDEPELKGIAFLMPNEESDRPLQDYMLSIDSLENITGLNFYDGFLDADLEAQLEGSYDPDLWKTSDKKFRLRVEKWNNQ
ncbi:MAG: DNA/RNA non-specific endonuclease [Bacteroidetes bacterium]|nr:DNA/RNA non-specific endonuclease [Bacteroidota bacterium]